MSTLTKSPSASTSANANAKIDTKFPGVGRKLEGDDLLSPPSTSTVAGIAGVATFITTGDAGLAVNAALTSATTYVAYTACSNSVAPVYGQVAGYAAGLVCSHTINNFISIANAQISGKWWKSKTDETVLEQNTKTNSNTNGDPQMLEKRKELQKLRSQKRKVINALKQYHTGLKNPLLQSSPEKQNWYKKQIKEHMDEYHLIVSSIDSLIEEITSLSNDEQLIDDIALHGFDMDASTSDQKHITIDTNQNTVKYFDNTYDTDDTVE